MIRDWPSKSQSDFFAKCIYFTDAVRSAKLYEINTTNKIYFEQTEIKTENLGVKKGPKAIKLKFHLFKAQVGLREVLWFYQIFTIHEVCLILTFEKSLKKVIWIFTRVARTSGLLGKSRENWIFIPEISEIEIDKEIFKSENF